MARKGEREGEKGGERGWGKRGKIERRRGEIFRKA
jgi:hypothetical protein